MRLTMLWWSPPGEGKTEIAKAVARTMQLPLEVFAGSDREPSDIGGVYYVVDGPDGEKMVMRIPLAMVRRLLKHERAVIFFDELSTSVPTVQAVMLRALLEGVMGDITLPPGIRPWAAANPPHQAAGGWDLGAALANRCYHFSYLLDADEFIQGHTVGWSVERHFADLDVSAYKSQLPQSKALVASFIHHRRGLLREVPVLSQAWASPRSWEMVMVAHALTQVALRGPEREDIGALMMAGAVGPGRAGEFLEWQRSLDLPDPMDWLKHPDSIKIPERGDRLFAALNSVVSLAVQRIDENMDAKFYWVAAWKVLHRVATNDHKDVATAVGRGLAQRRAKMGVEDVLHLMAPFATLMKKVGLV